MLLAALGRRALPAITRTHVIAASTSSSRTLATIASDIPVSVADELSSPQRGRQPRRRNAVSPRGDKHARFAKKHKFVVPAEKLVKAPPAPRYSRHSSRVKGRRAPTKPRKSLSQTEFDPVAGKYAPATQGHVRVLLPSVFMRLVRNGGREANDPYTATFRTHLQLTKLDVTNYLKNIYGLQVNSIRTMNYANKMKRSPLGGGQSRKGGTKNYKKVVVTMEKPFWYPKERSAEWCNEHFERDRTEAMRDRKMLVFGDGQKYGKQSHKYRGAPPPKEEVERATAIELGEVKSESFSERVGEAEAKKPRGPKKKTSILRNKAEQSQERRFQLEDEMARLQEEGY